MKRIEQPEGARIKELGQSVCEMILARNHIGRLAFSFKDRPDIEPISYVYKDGWIYGRTSHGTKTDTIGMNKWVAFEVDEVEGPFKWRSVVVKGPFNVMTQIAAREHDPTDTSIVEDPAFALGVALLRSMIPETFDASDPLPFRNTVFRIHLDEVTGREASPVQTKKPKQT
jgi:nitroimidazol reductase NimA-like FMN-containing flavoprotein (pyridoxamine 5'-phosphate oxidase superfamily)